jgi:predicted RNase H-like HicB family nuclease
MPKKDLEYYLGLPYTIEVVQHEEGYFARVVELDGCMTYADTAEELWPAVEEALRDWIGVGLEFGDPIPEPTPQDYPLHIRWRYPSPQGIAELVRAMLEEER